MKWIGVVWFLVCLSISLRSAWEISQLREIVSVSDGYHLKECYNEETLLRALKSAENFFAKGWLSVFQIIGWAVAVPLWVGGEEILIVWEPCVIFAIMQWHKVKADTVNVCYLVLRRQQERKILTDPEVSEREKIVKLKSLRFKHLQTYLEDKC